MREILWQVMPVIMLIRWDKDWIWGKWEDW